MLPSLVFRANLQANSRTLQVNRFAKLLHIYFHSDILENLDFQRTLTTGKQEIWLKSNRVTQDILTIDCKLTLVTLLARYQEI